MFSFLTADNYEDRKIDLYEDDNHYISTCYVPDGNHPYETGIASKLYLDSKDREDEFCIVEAYYTKEQAQLGHNKWVDLFQSGNLPDTLVDCKNAKLSQFIQDDIIFRLKK